MASRRRASYELPQRDRFSIDLEAVRQECPVCGQTLRRDGRCPSKNCERRLSREVDDLIALHESLQD